MVLFSTKFAVSDDFNKSEFFTLLQNWISSLPNCSMKLAYKEEEEYELSSDEDRYKLVAYSSKDCLAVQFTSRDDVAIHISTYVLRKMDDVSVMFIRLEKMLFQPSMKVDLSYESPMVMREMFWREYGGMDHGILTDDQPFLVRKTHVKFASEILNLKIKFYNPIVYVSMNADMGYGVDISALAARLTGIAHVVVDSNPYVASLLSETCEPHKDMKPGNIRVLFPNEEHADFDSETCDNLLDAVVSYIYQAMANVVVEDEFSFQKIKTQHLLSKLQSDHEVSEICDELLSQKDSEIRALQDEILKLKKSLSTAVKKSSYMESSLNKKTEKSDVKSGVLLASEKEKDFYPDERKDIILKLIQKEVGQMTGDSKLEKSRKFDVLYDIMTSNSLTGHDEEAMKTFKQIVESGTFNKGKRGDLERLGFTVTKSGSSHYILAYNGDSRYQFSVASTPSDYRAGENLAASYMNMVFGF